MIIEKLFEKYYIDKTNIELRNQIALKNSYLIDYYIRINGLNNNYHDINELRQEGFYILLRAVENFNPDLGNKFSTYAFKCLDGIKTKKIRYNSNLSLDLDISGFENIKLLDVIEYQEKDYSEIIDIEYKRNKLLKMLRKEFREREKSIIIDYYGMNGKSKIYADIVKEKKVSTNTISKTKKRLRYLSDKFDYEYFRSSTLFENDRISKTNVVHNPVEDYVIWKISLEELF